MSAINRNFVVRNGIEVNNNLIVADADLNKVGIGSTNPKFKLDVNGDFGTKTSYVSGLSTVSQEFNVGANGDTLTVLGNSKLIGIGTADPKYLLDIQSQVSAGNTTVFIRGDVFIEGGLNINFPGSGPGTLDVDSANIISLQSGSINNSGILTTNNLNITGPLFDSLDSTGVLGQYLKSTGTGVQWESFGVYRNRQTFISTEGQTDYVFSYESQYLDVYLNGVKLVPITEYTEISGGVRLVTPAFSGDIVELVSLVSSTDLILIDGASIAVSDNGANVGVATVLDFGYGLSVTNPSAGVMEIDVNINSVERSGIATNVEITSSTSSQVRYPTFATGIGSTGLSVNTSNLSFIPSTGKLGVNTTTPQRNLEVVGDIAFSNQLYATTLQKDVSTKSATLNSANRNSIGVNTSDLYVGYGVTETLGENAIPVDTFITSVGINSVGINNLHRVLVGSAITSLTFFAPTQISAGLPKQVLVSNGPVGPTRWADAASLVNVSVEDKNDDNTYYPVLSPTNSGITTLAVNSDGLTFNPSTNSLGIGSTAPKTELDVAGTVTAINYLGNGANLSGIVTQITAGIGVDITPTNGTGRIVIDSYRPTGKTIYVKQTGDDNNSGLSENYAKRTIKAAASIAVYGDTIRVHPGVYVEENPIVLKKTVSVQGTELRNCVVTPKYPYADLFYVNNGCHITNLSFIGPDMTDGAAVIALQKLEGVAVDRYFDAARMIRVNLDFIANETVSYISSTAYQNPAVSIATTDYIDYIKSTCLAVCHDITRGGNSKSIGIGASFFTNNVPNPGIGTTTIDALQYAAGIARSCVNNVSWTGNYQSTFTQVRDLSIQKDVLTNSNTDINSCSNVISALYSCVGVVTTIIQQGPSVVGTLFNKSYPGNSGIGFTTVAGITSAIYDEETGKVTITATGLKAIQGESIELRDLAFSCNSGVGISTQTFPSGKYGYDFVIDKLNNDGTIEVYVGPSTLPHTYAGGGEIVDRTVGITSALYDNITGITTITAPGLSIETGDLVRIRGLEFSCTSGSGTTTIYPTGNNGYDFRVLDIVTDKPIGVTSALYDNVTGIATITASGIGVSTNGIVELRNLVFSCSSGGGPSTALYPSGNDGYKFKVLSSTGSTFTVNVGVSTISHEYVSGGTAINRINTANDTFTINVGVSTIPHTYVSGGIAIPPFSRGVGPITQGPYVRNCTNFIPKSIGMKVDGFAAELGDQNDIGVTGTMSVDSYTQFNQGGIGVSITNGAYAQLVSIFTICDDIAVYTGSGGQCDITNSNSSFGQYGLYSEGVGDQNTKSIYRYTGVASTIAPAKTNTITVSGVGLNRPYDGQVCYFGDLYYFVDSIEIVDGGSGYTAAPRVTFSSPEGDNGITAQANTTIQDGKVVSINIVNSGTQYRKPPVITIAPPTGAGSAATAAVSKMQPIYYKVTEATLPSAGISTVTLLQTLNNDVGAGTTVYFYRGSLQLATTISFEHVGSGTNINTAKPALGGVVVPENQVIQTDGGIVVYTSTDQSGNFKIGDGVVINQATGQISGRDFTKALFTTMTPFILALSE